MYEFAHWLGKIIQLSILTFSRRQTLFKDIQMWLKREAKNLFWSRILDMFSLYNSFLSLKSKQCYLNSKYCCSSDFFFHHMVNELKGLYDEWFSICFCYCYIYIYIVSSLMNQTWLKCLVAKYNFLSLTICILTTVS